MGFIEKQPNGKLLPCGGGEGQLKNAGHEKTGGCQWHCRKGRLGQTEVQPRPGNGTFCLDDEKHGVKPKGSMGGPEIAERKEEDDAVISKYEDAWRRREREDRKKKPHQANL